MTREQFNGDVDTLLNDSVAEDSIAPSTEASAIKLSADYTDSEIAGLNLSDKEDVSNKSLNVNTDGSSNTKYPSVKAIKDYADGLVVGLLDDRGNYDASTNLFPSAGGSGGAGAVLKGDLWYISVAGTLGGVSVTIGASIRALVDTPAQTLANWGILNVGLGYTPENVVNKSTNTALGASDELYPSQKAVKTYVDSKAPTLTQGTISSLSGSSPYDVMPYDVNVSVAPVSSGVSLPTANLFIGKSVYIQTINSHTVYANPLNNGSSQIFLVNGGSSSYFTTDGGAFYKFTYLGVLDVYASGRWVYEKLNQ